MIRERKPEMTDAEAFRIYDESLALTEQMLGYESDAILVDAFTRTAICHNLFGEIAQPLKTAEEAADEPPPRWGGTDKGGGRRGRGAARPGGADGGSGADGGGKPGTLELLERFGGAKRQDSQRRSSSMQLSVSVPALPGVIGGRSPVRTPGLSSGSGGASGRQRWPSGAGAGPTQAALPSLK